MTPPVLPFGSVIGIEAASNAGMGHTARQVLQATVELPDEEIEPVGESTLGDPFCCLLTETNYTPEQIAASNGVLTRWFFKPPHGRRIAIGDVYQVDGDCEEPDTVEITGHVKKRGRVLRLFAAKDALLDQ